MNTTLENVVAEFEANADASIVKRCRKLVESGKAIWIWDPQVENVVGLVLSHNEKRALVVVYDDGADFEVDEEMLVQVR